MASGYTFYLDGPLSLFMATNRYGLQMALFLPALLPCSDFRLDAELRWGPKRIPRTFHLESADGLVSHYQDAGQYVPAEIQAFLDRFRQVAPDWKVSESTELVDLGREGVWVPDYSFEHLPTGTDVLVEILGFWKRSALDRLLRLLPMHGPPRYVLAISDSMKVDEGAIQELSGPVLRFKEIPNAKEMLGLLRGFLPGASRPTLLDDD
jgi:predicted nuclease of restriction endonuclease-like RecB superfamily